MYKRDGLVGGHVIMLGTSEVNTKAAVEALQAYPGGLQVGGQNGYLKALLMSSVVTSLFE